MMGKKKPRKTKELSVAIAEATTSSAVDEAKQQLPTPRKRGRPRKIPKPEQEVPKASLDDADENDAKTSSGGLKRGKTKELDGGIEEVAEEVEKGKEQNQSEDKEHEHGHEPIITRSRGRRKSYKPRKSS